MDIKGIATVEQTFSILSTGTIIIGAKCVKGTISLKDRIEIIRNNTTIFTGNIKTLKRFNQDVNEVTKDQEFGMTIEDFNDILQNDIIHSF